MRQDWRLQPPIFVNVSESTRCPGRCSGARSADTTLGCIPAGGKMFGPKMACVCGFNGEGQQLGLHSAPCLQQCDREARDAWRNAGGIHIQAPPPGARAGPAGPHGQRRAWTVTTLAVCAGPGRRLTAPARGAKGVGSCCAHCGCCLSMKLSKAAETQRMSHRGFQSLCHIRVRTVQLPPYVVVTSSDLDTSRNKASVSGLSWISRLRIDYRVFGQ